MLDYDLLDSGEGKKLERFGSKILIRPSSTAIWQKRTRLWDKVDAEFILAEGWRFKHDSFDEWLIKLDGLKLQLRLQNNGQIGLFPEHFQYLNDISDSLSEYKKEALHPKVLNLFAYTGMASLFCRNLDAEVVHVDKSKNALSWANENLKLNNITSGVRLIPEDALLFLEREEKRGHKYHIIIADPPNFSRLNKNENWDLDAVILPLLKAMLSVLEKDGTIFLSAHQSYGFAESVNNLISDFIGDSSLKSIPLAIREKSTKRLMPAGIILYGKI